MQYGDLLHFELPYSGRIKVFEGDSTNFFVCMALRNVYEQGAKSLQLALDTEHVTKGIEAITAATGNDIPTPEQGWGVLISEEIVVSTISGPQSGVWEKGLYMVSDDISVAVGDTLTLSEGVEIVFPDGVNFSINGVLHAEEAVLIDGGGIEIAGFVEISDSEVGDVLFTVTDGGQLNLIRTDVITSSINATDAVLYTGGCTFVGPDDISVSGGSIIVMGSEFHDYEVSLENLSRMEIQWNNFMDTPGIALRMVGDFDGEFIRNNIFFNNGTAIHAETSSVFELSHNCFFGNLFDLNEGEGVVDFGLVNTTNTNGDPSDQHFNIFLNPQFGDAENGNYNLMFGSPCIGAGSDGDDIGAHKYDPSGIETNEEKVPDEVQLHQNYPNPFNPVTTIEFTLNTEMKVSLSVYNVAGEKVARLVNNRNMTQGSHAVPFNAVGLTSGIYYYILEAQNVVITNKMVLTK